MQDMVPAAAPLPVATALAHLPRPQALHNSSVPALHNSSVPALHQRSLPDLHHRSTPALRHCVTLRLRCHPVTPQQADIQLILKGVLDLRQLDTGRVGWSPGAYASELAAPTAWAKLPSQPAPSKQSPRSKPRLQDGTKPRDSTSRRATRRHPLPSV